jgi:hypothetical protein
LIDDLNQESKPDQLAEPPPRRRRSLGPAMGVIVLAGLAGASAYLWLNDGDRLRSAIFASPPADAPVIAGGEEAVGRADFEAFKKQASDSLRSATEHVDAQKADIRRLSDQMADLAAKLDSLQSVTSSAPAQTSAAPQQPVAPPRLVAAAQRKRLVIAKPSGPISLGGAPLPETPNQDTR